MSRTFWLAGLLGALVSTLVLNLAAAQEWPQWRGPNRDARATGFKAPAAWPKELKKTWSVEVGDGVATPALVDGKLYVFTRVGEEEVIRALDANTHQELWQDKYPASRPRGGASGFAGPRSSPTVADGKVVTLGVDGTLGCYDAQSGAKLWQKEGEFGGEVPQFYTSSSPIVVDGLCIAQLGGRDEGGIIAFDLASGEQKWQWDGDGPAYSSPVLMNVGGTNLVIAPTQRNLVALGTDGAVKWEIPYEQGGRYNSATPIVTGDTLILAGPGSGISAIKLTVENGQVKEERSWANRDNSVQFNTPVLKDGLLFGLSNGGQLFCINTATNETTWTAPISRPAAEGEDSSGRSERAAQAQPARVPATFVQLAQQDNEERPERGEGRDRGEGFRRGGRDGRGGGFGRGFGRGRGGRRGGGGGYGSIVDAGSVLIALSPAAELVVFKPTGEAYDEVARYKVAEGGTYAYPVPAGDSIYIKDQNHLTKWAVE